MRTVVETLLLISLTCVAGCKKTDPTPDASTPEMPGCGATMGASTPLHLLNRAEYNNTVRDLLGDTSRPANDFPREPLAFGFDNNADLVKVTPETVNAYLTAGETLAAATVKDRKSTLISCPAGETLACGQAWVVSFGRKAFRRPLTMSEQTTFQAFFAKTLQSEKSFDTALEWTLQVMLQSPQFLYRSEPSLSAVAGVRKLSGDELASRLSYFLWNSQPDQPLLDAAAAGQLATVEGLTAQATRMQADQKSKDAVAHFFSLWLTTENIGNLSKSPTVYPGFDAQLASSLRGSLEQYARASYFEGKTLKALLTSPTLFVDGRMATAYGLPTPANGAMGEVTDPRGHYKGLLTQPGLMANLASPDQSSPIRRGLFVLRNLMCVPISPPPPTVNAVPPGLNPGKTTRERFAAHDTDPSCAPCHTKIDPIGFGFEHFDGMGTWRDKEGELDVDASGAVNAGFDDALKGDFSTIQQLEDRLADSRQVHDCFATQMVRFAIARAEAPADACAVEAVQQKFFDSGGSFEALQLAIISSDTFRFRAEPGGAP